MWTRVRCMIRAEVHGVQELGFRVRALSPSALHPVPPSPKPHQPHQLNCAANNLVPPSNFAILLDSGSTAALTLAASFGPSPALWYCAVCALSSRQGFSVNPKSNFTALMIRPETWVCVGCGAGQPICGEKAVEWAGAAATQQQRLVCPRLGPEGPAG